MNRAASSCVGDQQRIPSVVCFAYLFVPALESEEHTCFCPAARVLIAGRDCVVGVGSLDLILHGHHERTFDLQCCRPMAVLTRSSLLVSSVLGVLFNVLTQRSFIPITSAK